jgi:hypothetical protein
MEPEQYLGLDTGNESWKDAHLTVSVEFKIVEEDNGNIVSTEKKKPAH